MKNNAIFYKAIIILFLVIFTDDYKFVGAQNLFSIKKCEISLDINSKLNSKQIRSRGILSKYYTNIEQMVDESDFILLGTFSEIIKITKINSSQFLTLKRLEKKPRKYLTSLEINQILSLRDPGHRDIEFLPLEILKGHKISLPITIAQRGAINQETTLNTVKPMEEDTFFQPKDTYILFLVKPLPHERDLAGKDFYWITGASQGAFFVKNQKVYSRNSIGQIPLNVGPLIQGEPLNSFLSKVRRKVKSKSKLINLNQKVIN